MTENSDVAAPVDEAALNPEVYRRAYEYAVEELEATREEMARGSARPMLQRRQPSADHWHRLALLSERIRVLEEVLGR
jgi:hypothetical protein